MTTPRPVPFLEELLIFYMLQVPGALWVPPKWGQTCPKKVLVKKTKTEKKSKNM